MEMEAISCPQTARVGSLDILHFVCDERALFLSPGIDKGRFSQERRLFIFILRWGVRHTTKVWVVSEETWGPEWPGHSGPVSAMGNWCPRKFSCGTSGSTDRSLIRATVSPRLPTSLPSLRTLSLTFCESLSRGQCGFGVPCMGSCSSGDLVLTEAQIDLLLNPNTAAQQFRGGEFDQRKKLPHLGSAREWSRPQDDRKDLDLESGALNFGK